MKLRLGARAALDSSDEQLVERPAPGAAPTAFRIWKAGENRTDDGPIYFTEQSASLLLEQQEKRGNLFSIDFDHLSVKENRPAEAGRAAGWHRLEVRDSDEGPELWAVDVEWCADTKAGLEEEPPRWRYFSPAYFTDPETAEVVSYLNTALCVNPATWNNTQLAMRAGRRRESMRRSTLLAALKAIAEGDGSDEEKKKATAAYAAMGGDEELKKCKAAEGDDKKPDDEEEDEEDEEDEEPPSSEKPGGENKKPDDEEEDEEDEEDEPTSEKTPKPFEVKKKTKRAKARDATVKLATRLTELEAKLEHQAVQRLIERHQDRFTASTRAWALTQPKSVVESFIKSAPKLNMSAPQPKVAPRGDKQGTGAAETSPEASDKLDRILGITKSPEKLGWSGYDANTGTVRFNAADPAKLRQLRTNKRPAPKEG